MDERDKGFIVVGEKDWANATPEQRDWMVYQTLQSLNNRMTTLECRPLAHKFLSFVGGLVGGFIAAIGLKWGMR